MEIAKVFQSLLAGGFVSYVAAAVALGSVFLKVLTALSRTLEFHDKHFVRKPIVRLRALRQAVSNTPELVEFFDRAIQQEAFRLATRIDTSRVKRQYLLELDSRGIWSRNQLRSVSKFLLMSPNQKAPVITITRLDTAGAWFSVFAVFGTILVGGAHSLLLIFTGDPLYVLAGVFTACLFLLAVRFFATDFTDWLIAKRVQAYLAWITQNN